jgi:hypothetical protein
MVKREIMQCMKIVFVFAVCLFLAGSASAAVIIPQFSYVDTAKNRCYERTQFLWAGDSLKFKGFEAKLDDVASVCLRRNKLVAIRYDRYSRTYQDPLTPGIDYEYTIEPESCLQSNFHAFVTLSTQGGNRFLPYPSEITTRQGFSGTFGENTVYLSTSGMFAGYSKNSKWAKVTLKVCTG